MTLAEREARAFARAEAKGGRRWLVALEYWRRLSLTRNEQ